MRTFCIGDIHGGYKALIECLQRSSFDYQQDRLIVLGDVCDGYPQVDRCINELLKIAHCDYILGNHDLWALDWALRDEAPDLWVTQGGQGTLSSYPNGMPQAHIDFLKHGRFYLELDNKIFVHGGFDPSKPIKIQQQTEFAWDRKMIYDAWSQSVRDPNVQIGSYEEIYLGHTPTHRQFDSKVPLKMGNVWAMDTGAGWGECLSIMDIDTKEYWQSQANVILYNGSRGR